MALLDVRGLTVELPTAAGWVRPVNEVSLRLGAGESGSGKTGHRAKANSRSAGSSPKRPRVRT